MGGDTKCGPDEYYEPDIPACRPCSIPCRLSPALCRHFGCKVYTESTTMTTMTPFTSTSVKMTSVPAPAVTVTLEPYNSTMSTSTPVLKEFSPRDTTALVVLSILTLMIILTIFFIIVIVIFKRRKVMACAKKENQTFVRRKQKEDNTERADEGCQPDGDRIFKPLLATLRDMGKPLNNYLDAGKCQTTDDLFRIMAEDDSGEEEPYGIMSQALLRILRRETEIREREIEKMIREFLIRAGTKNRDPAKVSSVIQPETFHKHDRNIWRSEADRADVEIPVEIHVEKENLFSTEAQEGELEPLNPPSSTAADELDRNKQCSYEGSTPFSAAEKDPPYKEEPPGHNSQIGITMC